MSPCFDLSGDSFGYRSCSHPAAVSSFDRHLAQTGRLPPELHEIDHRHRVANFGIVIGEKDCWNRGYGTEATRLVLDYGFNCLGLHNIMLEVFGFNRWAIRAYLAAGFKEIGRRREAHRLGGMAHDVIYMDCLATEFVSPVLRRLSVEEPAGEGSAGR